MSAQKLVVSSSVTVRQTPFTATLSPRLSCAAKSVAIRTRYPDLFGVRSASRPTASTMPVNIGFDPGIGPARLDDDVAPCSAGNGIAVQPRNSGRPQHVRCDHDVQPIDDTGLAEGGLQLRTALDQKGRDVPGEQRVEAFNQRRRHQDHAAGPFYRL